MKHIFPFQLVRNEFFEWLWFSSAFLKMCEGKMDFFQRRTVAQLFVWLQSDFIFFLEKQTSANKRQKAVLGTSVPPWRTCFYVSCCSGSEILIISAVIQVIKLIKINVSLLTEIHCRIKGESLPALYSAAVTLFSLRK